VAVADTSQGRLARRTRVRPNRWQIMSNLWPDTEAAIHECRGSAILIGLEKARWVGEWSGDAVVGNMR